MTAMELLRSAAALAAVLGTIFLGAWIFRRTRFAGAPAPLGRARTLRVIETAMIDARRKAAVLRWRDRDYLVVFSGDHGVVIADGRPVDTAEDGAKDPPDRGP